MISECPSCSAPLRNPDSCGKCGWKATVQHNQADLDRAYRERMDDAKRRMEERLLDYVVTVESRRICKLSTPDERRDRIASFEKVHGTQMGEKLKEAVRVLWSKRAAA